MSNRRPRGGVNFGQAFTVSVNHPQLLEDEGPQQIEGVEEYGKRPNGNQNDNRTSNQFRSRRPRHLAHFCFHRDEKVSERRPVHQSITNPGADRSDEHRKDKAGSKIVLCNELAFAYSPCAEANRDSDRGKRDLARDPPLVAFVQADLEKASDERIRIHNPRTLSSLQRFILNGRHDHSFA